MFVLALMVCQLLMVLLSSLSCNSSLVLLVLKFVRDGLSLIYTKLFKRCHVQLSYCRPYSGKLDSLGNLALPDPALPSGKKPCGFLGYAVNMIHIDILKGRVMTNEGYSLRETLFYRLFGDVQVYRTREDMRQARSCLKSGAVSLDGGIIRGNGVVGEGEL